MQFRNQTFLCNSQRRELDFKSKAFYQFRTLCITLKYYKFSYPKFFIANINSNQYSKYLIIRLFLIAFLFVIPLFSQHVCILVKSIIIMSYKNCLQHFMSMLHNVFVDHCKTHMFSLALLVEIYSDIENCIGIWRMFD